jgi:hypothetical protein
LPCEARQRLRGVDRKGSEAERDNACGDSKSGSPVQSPNAAQTSLLDTFAVTHHFIPFVVVSDENNLGGPVNWTNTRYAPQIRREHGRTKFDETYWGARERDKP